MAAPRRTLPVAILFLLCFAPFGPPASAQTGGVEILKSLSGTWKGRGTARKSSTAAAEPISCRYEGKLDGNGLTLALNYICLGVEFKFESRGTLTFEPDSDRFALSLTIAGVDRKVEGSGRRRGSGVELTIAGQHPDTGKEILSYFSMAISGAGKLVNVLRSTDTENGRNFKALQATFSR